MVNTNYRKLPANYHRYFVFKMINNVLTQIRPNDRFERKFCSAVRFLIPNTVVLSAGAQLHFGGKAVAHRPKEICTSADVTS